MKNKIFTSLVISLFLFPGIKAQTEKGKFLLGGNTSLSISNVEGKMEGSEPQKNTIVKLMPGISYFVADNFSVGIAGMYDYQSVNIGADVSLLTDFRYYLSKSRVKPYLKINAGYRNGNKQIASWQYEYDASVHGLVAGGGLGTAFFLSDNISLDVTGQYFFSKLNDLGDGYFDSSTNSSFKIKTTNQEFRLFVGLSFYL